MNAVTALFSAALLLLVVQGPAVAQSDPRYGADVVLLDGNGTRIFHGQTSVVASSTSGIGGTSFGEGSASLGGVVDLIATASDSIATGGAIARVDIFDTLTFHVAGGGSAVVPVLMSGDWAAQGNGSKATYTLSLISRFSSSTYQGYSFSNGLAESFVNGLPAVPVMAIASGDVGAGVVGSYDVIALFNVVDGGIYSFSAGVGAEAVGSTRAFIEDPLTIDAPAGVTFTAASNNSYQLAAVPEPSVWGLMIGGLIGLAKLRRSRRAA